MDNSLIISFLYKSSEINIDIKNNTSATITWTTNELSDSTINIGLTSSYGTASTTSTLATSHSIIIPSLTATTTYHYQISSTDASGNVSTSADLTFITAPPDWVLSGAAVDIDFAGNQAYGDTIANTVSITRASTAYAQTSTGTLTSFGSNVLRQTDLGLLIEPAATNLLTQSQTFTSPWALTNASISTSGTAPDGTGTSILLTENSAASTGHLILSSTSKAASALTYTLSIYAKANGRTRVSMQLDNAAGNGTTGVCDISGQQVAYGPAEVGTSFTNTSMSATPMGNGWMRCAITGTSDTGTSIRGIIRIDSGTSDIGIKLADRARSNISRISK